MLINHITSGSSGNAILVDDGETKLLLDAGISYKKIARWIRPTKLAGALITHCHQDHCKAVPELIRRGVTIGMSEGTANTLGADAGFPISYEPMTHGQEKEIGTWKVLPFDVEHDTPEPLGFLIQSTVTGKKAVYIVDSAYVQYNFSGVTHWLIECNYSEELLEEGPYEEYLKDRVRKNHFSLEDLLRFFFDSDLSETEEIYLLHLSDANSDEEAFEKGIQRLTGKPVYTISDSPSRQRVPQNTANGPGRKARDKLQQEAT